MPRIDISTWELSDAEGLAHDHFNDLLELGYSCTQAIWCVRAVHDISDDFVAWLTN